MEMIKGFVATTDIYTWDLRTHMDSKELNLFEFINDTSYDGQTIMYKKMEFEKEKTLYELLEFLKYKIRKLNVGISIKIKGEREPEIFPLNELDLKRQIFSDNLPLDKVSIKLYFEANFDEQSPCEVTLKPYSEGADVVLAICNVEFGSSVTQLIYKKIKNEDEFRTTFNKENFKITHDDESHIISESINQDIKERTAIVFFKTIDVQIKESDIELRPNENFFHTKYGWCYYELHPKSPFIYNLFVHPEYRRKGIATKLLKLVIDEINKSDFEDTIHILLYSV
jgi:predicted GNAT family acetyltransferase